MDALYDLLETDNLASVARHGVIVSKPCCPVCQSVLEAFGVVILDNDCKNGNYFSYWRSPWSQKAKRTRGKKSDGFRETVRQAAEPHADNCTLYL
jgi:hypothetical protein